MGDTKRKSKSVDMEVETMILTDCVNDVQRGHAKPRFYKIGKQYGVHHNCVRRMWERMSGVERASYEDMIEKVQEKVAEHYASNLEELNGHLLVCAKKALDIWESRLDSRPASIADRDLISFILKVIQQPQEQEEEKTTKGGLIFNIIDQSITEYHNG